MQYQSENQICQNCKNDFIIESDDFSFYEKMKVPPPTFCPTCRRIRRLSWRNDYSLYSRKCFLCTKNFISVYEPSKFQEVLCPKCFHGDSFDAYEYGVDYNPNKSFIEQVIELYYKIPKLGIVNDNDIASINCLYTNDVAFSKNCSMVFIAWRIENVLYSTNLGLGKDLCDCLGIFEEAEYSYEAVMSGKIAYCKNVYWCNSCINCVFCYDCRGSNDCFMSFGLRNKKYVFKNQQYTKEEYEKILNSYELHTRSGYLKAKKEYLDYIKSFPRKFAELRNCVNSTGTDMIRSKNVKASNTSSFSENSKFVHEGVSFNTCYDCAVGGETELAYECITPDHSYNSLVTIESWKNNNIAYSIDSHSCQNVLGCIGIKNGQYVILNKKYSKEEYQKLYEYIVNDMKKRGEWGEFFPSNLSPFGINETQAIHQLNFSKKEAINKGYNWQDNIQQTFGKETIAQEKVPNSIDDVHESIINEVLKCESCNRNYKILENELVFYKRLKIPIPLYCFFCRYKERQGLRPGYDLVSKECDCENTKHNHIGKCKNSFETLFTEKEERPIYCEKCYQAEVY